MSANEIKSLLASAPQVLHNFNSEHAAELSKSILATTMIMMIYLRPVSRERLSTMFHKTVLSIPVIKKIKFSPLLLPANKETELKRSQPTSYESLFREHEI